MERNSECYNTFISDSNNYSISCGHNINTTNHNHCQLSVTLINTTIFVSSSQQILALPVKTASATPLTFLSATNAE